MLDLKVKREPFWLDIAPGIRIKVRPCSSALMLAARSAPGGDFMNALAKAAILEWEGINFGDEPAPVTDANIDAVLDLLSFYRAFEDKYFGKALRFEDEKNA